MSVHFKILSIDGGGFRGAYSAFILKRMEEEYSINCLDTFDMIAGTSTGSIIAGGLASGKTASEIFTFYEKSGKAIFKKRYFCRMGLFASRYKNGRLKEVLKTVIGAKTLGEIDIPLIIPATDIGNGCVHVFKSNYHGELVRDKDVNLIDAILASCAAPTYFDPHNVQAYLLVDGGLWANNPSLVAAIDAKRRLGVSLDRLRILSLGTGITREFYSQRICRWNRLLGWGLLAKWERDKFIKMLLNLQALNANNMLHLLLDHGQILRLNFESDKLLPLDDPGMIKDWVSKADHDFTHKSHLIREFLDLNTNYSPIARSKLS